MLSVAIVVSLGAKTTSLWSRRGAVQDGFETFLTVVKLLLTDDATFGAILVATALLVGGLSFFPVLALGPIAEHFTLTTKP